MTQLAQPKLTFPGQIRSSHWFAPVAIVLVAAVLMAFAIVAGDNKPASSAVDQPQQQALRPGGGPEETAVAASVAPRAEPANAPVPIGPLGRRR